MPYDNDCLDDPYGDIEYDRDPYGDAIIPPDDDDDVVDVDTMPPDDDDLIDGVGFADPGGHSALRAATPRNPRNLPCPTCKQPNRLTPADRRRGYQCDQCADRDEGRMGGDY